MPVSCEMTVVRLGRASWWRQYYQVKTVSIDRIRGKSIYAPLIPRSVVGEVGQRSPGIVRVESICASNITSEDCVT